jgi:alpha-tubulin suppressor-like RCC1 family protein
VTPGCSTEPDCTPLQPGEVAVGVQSSCALVGDGTAKCWGSSGYGQLGTGVKGAEQATAATVVGLSGLKMLASGEYHACALDFDGIVSCWGGLLLDDRPPFAVPGLSDVAMIAAGGSHTCALRRDGRVLCWGHKFDGSVPQPIAVDGITDAKFIATADGHGCAALAGGAVSCWDQGDDMTLSASAQGVSDAALVAVGGGFSCVLTTQFRVNCWGSQAPSGNPEDVVVLTANERSACIAQPNTFPQCSGGNQLASTGLGESTNRELDLAQIKGVAIGAYHGCVVAGDPGARSAFCWGSNSRGQLGARVEDSVTPVRVLDFP